MSSTTESRDLVYSTEHGDERTKNLSPMLLLPNELLGMFLLPWDNEYQDPSPRRLQLASVCRRFRQILTPPVYRNVELLNTLPQRRVSFLKVMPVQGHLVHSLHIRIQCEHANDRVVLQLLHQQCRNLTSLKVLLVDLELDPPAKTKPYIFSSHDDPEITYIPSSTRMSPAQLIDWIVLCARLPSTMTEFYIHGFSWADAAKGLREVDLPNLRSLGLCLDGTVQSPTMAFLANLPNLIDLALSATLCLPVALPREFLDNRTPKLEKLVIGLRVDHNASWYTNSQDVIQDPEPGPQRHVCSAKKCNFSQSIGNLLLGSAPTLTTLVLGTPTILGVTLPIGAFTALTSLHLNYIPLNNSQSRLEALLIPFMASPLVHLEFTQCGQIPQEFSSWFDPTATTRWPKHSHSLCGVRWPKLEKLSIDCLFTSFGPGDDSFDAYLLKNPGDLGDVGTMIANGDYFWHPASRLALERYCQERDIVLKVDWDWFEGFG